MVIKFIMNLALHCKLGNLHTNFFFFICFPLSFILHICILYHSFLYEYRCSGCIYAYLLLTYYLFCWFRTIPSHTFYLLFFFHFVYLLLLLNFFSLHLIARTPFGLPQFIYSFLNVCGSVLYVHNFNSFRFFFYFFLFFMLFAAIFI